MLLICFLIGHFYQTCLKADIALSEKFGLMVGLDLHKMQNCGFSDAFLLVLCVEYIGDDDKLILGASDRSILGLTISGNYKKETLTIIPEFRFNSAVENVIPDEDSVKMTSSIRVFQLVMVCFFSTK